MKKRSVSILWTALLALVVISAVLLASVRPVQAAVYRKNGVLSANETINDDLFIGANDVRVDGTVNGILFAAGQTVTLNGTINGDAFLFARDIVVSDKAVITGNLFIGAQNISVQGKVTNSMAGGGASLVFGSSAAVGGNLYFGGYNLETRASSQVGRGLYFGGYQASLNGSIVHELAASAGAVELNGSVGDDATINVGAPGQTQMAPYFNPQLPPTIPPGLRIGSGAKIGGKLIYTSAVNQDSAVQAAPAGGIVYQTPEPGRNGTPAARYPGAGFFGSVLSWFVSFLRNLFTLLLLGLLAVWLLPALVNRASQIAQAKPVQSAGYGLLTLIVGYVGAFLAAIVILVVGILFSIVTLGGLSRTIFGVGFSSLALVVTAFTLLVSYVSKLVVAYLIGDLILAGAAPTLTGRRYWAIVLGVLIYALIRSIPIVGFLVGAIVTIIGLGAIWLLYRAWRKPAPEAAIENI